MIAKLLPWRGDTARVQSLLALLLLALLTFGGRAEATTTCRVTGIDNINFGFIDPSSGQADASAQINYTCTYNGILLLGSLNAVNVRACVSLGAGNGSSSSALNNRQLLKVNGNGERMSVQLYKDAARTSVWGGINGGAYTAQTASLGFTILANGQTQDGSMTLYARVPAGQGVLSSGTYLSQFFGDNGNNVFSYRYTEALLGLGAAPSSCQAGGNGGGNVALPSFYVNASVSAVASCRVGSASDPNLGGGSSLLAAKRDEDALGVIVCSNGPPRQIGLDDGQHASGAQRRLRHGNDYADYELYRDRAHSQRWDDTLDDTAGQESGDAEQTVQVYGKLPPASTGPYGDVITVTITY